MSEKEQLESSQAAGTEGAPTSDSSGSQGVQQSSPFDAEQLLKQIETLIDRKLQSQKDRRIARIEETVSAFQPVLERLKGLVPDDKLATIQRDLEWEDIKRRVYGESSSDSKAGNHESNTTDGMAQVIDEVFELPTNDPRVTRLKVTYANDIKGYLAEAWKLAVKLKEAEEDSTPAEQPLPTGGTARKVDNPIADIDDPKLLYKLAAQQMRGERRK